MKQNMLTYIAKQGAVPFSQAPLTPVDSLIMSQLSYLKFTLINSAQPVKLSSLKSKYLYQAMCANVLNPPLNQKLIKAVAGSRRFGEISVALHTEDVDPSQEKQFSATTFLLPGNQCYIAYRGTDATFLGIKEDMNMAYMAKVPAQEEALKYLENTARLTEGPIYMGGHSKGGNLAEYAAAMCPLNTFERIKAVYSHDGPGFRKEIVAEKGFARAQTKFYKTVPQSSVIGLLMMHNDNFKAVKSKRFGIMQHDPFSWLVKGNDFIYAPGLSGMASYFRETVDKWMNAINDEKRAAVIDTINAVFTNTNAKSLIDFKKNWYGCARETVEAAKALDEPLRKQVLETMNDLFKLLLKLK